MVKGLIEKGADVNIADNEGRTALAHACVRGNSKLTKLLLQAGSLVNVVRKKCFIYILISNMHQKLFMKSFEHKRYTSC